MHQDLIEQIVLNEAEGGSACVITQSSSHILAQGTEIGYGRALDFWATLFRMSPEFKCFIEESIAMSELEQ